MLIDPLVCLNGKRRRHRTIASTFLSQGYATLPAIPRRARSRPSADETVKPKFLAALHTETSSRRVRCVTNRTFHVYHRCNNSLCCNCQDPMQAYRHGSVRGNRCFLRGKSPVRRGSAVTTLRNSLYLEKPLK